MLYLSAALIGLIASLESGVFSPGRIKLEPLEKIVKSTEVSEKNMHYFIFNIVYMYPI